MSNLRYISRPFKLQLGYETLDNAKKKRRGIEILNPGGDPAPNPGEPFFDPDNISFFFNESDQTVLRIDYNSETAEYEEEQVADLSNILNDYPTYIDQLRDGRIVFLNQPTTGSVDILITDQNFLPLYEKTITNVDSLYYFPKRAYDRGYNIYLPSTLTGTSSRAYLKISPDLETVTTHYIANPFTSRTPDIYGMTICNGRLIIAWYRNFENGHITSVDLNNLGLRDHNQDITVGRPMSLCVSGQNEFMCFFANSADSVIAVYQAHPLQLKEFKVLSDFQNSFNPGTASSTHGIAVDDKRVLYHAGSSGRRVYKIDYLNEIVLDDKFISRFNNRNVFVSNKGIVTSGGGLGSNSRKRVVHNFDSGQTIYDSSTSFTNDYCPFANYYNWQDYFFNG